MIKKDITASGRQFDVAEKMSDYPDIDLFFMIMRLRLLYVSGQGYTRMKLRTLLKHYGTALCFTIFRHVSEADKNVM